MKHLSLRFSLTSESAATISWNNTFINCTDFNVNGNKNSAEIVDNIRPLLSHNINTPILVKHGQPSTELQALKHYIPKIKAQMSVLKNM